MTNVSLQNVTTKKSVIVGFSSGNAADLNNLKNTRGIITPRTDGLRVDDITFANFGPQMTPLQSCSKCEHRLFHVSGGKTTFFNNVKFTNIQGNYIFWNLYRREIFIDEDGSLTVPIKTALSLPNGTFGGITPYFDHLRIPGRCFNITAKWDNSTYCDQTITLRSVLFSNADPYSDFVGQNLRTYRLTNLTDFRNPPTFEVVQQIIIKVTQDIKNSWAYPYAVGQNYGAHFSQGIDFLNLSVAPSLYWQPNEALILRFNYTDQGEFY